MGPHRRHLSIRCAMPLVSMPLSCLPPPPPPPAPGLRGVPLPLALPPLASEAAAAAKEEAAEGTSIVPERPMTSAR